MQKEALADHATKTVALQNKNNQLMTVFHFQPPGKLTDILLKFQEMAPERHLDTKRRKIQPQQRVLDRPKWEVYPSVWSSTR